jgi:biopolymer transport protein ExbD
MKIKMSLRLKTAIFDPVPLVNIAFIVVLFFVFLINFIGKKGIVVDLPKIDQAALYNLDSVVVTLLGKKVFLYENEISIDKLNEELTKRNPKLLAIKAGKDVPYSSIAEIIQIAQNIGIKQIAMAVDSDKVR